MTTETRLQLSERLLYEGALIRHELLAALKVLVASHGGPVFQGDPHTEGNGIAQARAAIAKAERY